MLPSDEHDRASFHLFPLEYFLCSMSTLLQEKLEEGVCCLREIMLLVPCDATDQLTGG